MPLPLGLAHVGLAGRAEDSSEAFWKRLMLRVFLLKSSCTDVIFP